MGLKDVTGEQLIKALVRQGYSVTRQKGSHVRLTVSLSDQSEKHITVPAHKPFKYGTLMGIIKDVAAHLNISKSELIDLLKL